MIVNRRIVLNIVATYGRSLFSLLCGLIGGRWLLRSLGAESLGLYGMIAGLVVFITIFNNVFSSAVSRFYAYSIGEGDRAKSESVAISLCQRWFSIALCFYVVVPLMCSVIGYPVGAWAIRNWLNIPSEKVEVCIAVFRLVCFSSYCVMLNVPFRAMFIAKQYIAELTVFSFVQSCMNILFLYYMVTHPGEWLLYYAYWVSGVEIVIQLLICVRAALVFRECRLNLKYCLDIVSIRRLFGYAAWQSLTALGTVFNSQGISILVNKSFSPVVNAALTVSQQVNAQAMSLTTAMQGAFTPAITSYCGAEKFAEMKRMALAASKFGSVLFLLFAIPLVINIRFVMELWLLTPPPYSVELCVFLLIGAAFEKMSLGQMIAVNATGKIAMFQATMGLIFFMVLPVACVLVWVHRSPLMVGVSLVIMQISAFSCRIYFGRIVASIKVSESCAEVLPVVIVSVACILLGLLVRESVENGLFGFLISTFFSVVIYLCFVWRFVLTIDEKSVIWYYVKKIGASKL